MDKVAILDAWGRVIVSAGWTAARIDAVARDAGVPIADVAVSYPDRWAALRGLQQRFDSAALIEAASDPDDSIRNRLFALFMARFDAAQDQRALIEALSHATRRDPALAAFFVAAVPRSVARIAEAAGIDCGGVWGPIRVAVLSALYGHVARVWLADASVDLAPTMKALDAALAKAEQLARWLPHRAAVTARPEVPAPSDGFLPE